jgi:hypothetical protein
MSCVKRNGIYPTDFGIGFVFFCFVSPVILSLREYISVVNERAFGVEVIE